MSCIISAPATGNGKTTVSLLISSWAYSKGLKLQTFKVGPDYLDQQQLSSIGHPICRNLDIFLSGEQWIQETFIRYTKDTDLSLIEGAMGLFDGLGSTDFSSTANVSKVLKLPIIFVVDAKGKVASLLPILRGFKDFDNEVSIKGIIFNNVNSERHQKLINEVFKNESIKILGFLPHNEKIALSRGNLGLTSPKELEKQVDVDYYANFAEKHLNISQIVQLLKPTDKKHYKHEYSNLIKLKNKRPIAIAEDKIFHFQYPETKEFFKEIGIPIISWNIYEDEEIPLEAKALIIPGGFPEKYAEHISSSKRSLDSLRNFYKKGFIYAECGGMMILGQSIEDQNGCQHKMGGILPLNFKKGNLSVGYRYIKGKKNSLFLKENQFIRGHEFHYWQIKNDSIFQEKDFVRESKFRPSWDIKSWGTKYKEEGLENKYLHASWIHLHLPSNLNAAKNLLNITQSLL
tara:strand:+ start:646 stop:2022 length:1377 start_codon:yes stop_codon:yes gene_type:complete